MKIKYKAHFRGGGAKACRAKVGTGFAKKDMLKQRDGTA
jgi:hypothetical protein